MKRNIDSIPIISDADMSKLFEGDIQKTPNFMKMLRKAKLLKRDAMTKRTWPDGIVPYRFERKFGKNNGNNLNSNNDISFCFEFFSSFSITLLTYMEIFEMHYYLN